jgi:hypothetical protein
MSKRLDVLQAVKALIQRALPTSDVIGLDNDSPVPARPAPGGRAVVRSGDAGEPEVDLSPLCYNYEHEIPVELTGWRDGDLYGEELLDALMERLGEVIEQDRTLGGLCSWLEARSPLTDDIYFEGAAPQQRADLVIVASYSTPNPLS